MFKFRIVETGDYFYTFYRLVFCEDANVGIQFEYNEDIGCWERSVMIYRIDNIEGYAPCGPDGNWCTVKMFELGKEATQNFLSLIEGVRKEGKERAEYSSSCLDYDIDELYSELY